MCRRESGRDSAKPCDLNLASCVNDTTIRDEFTSEKWVLESREYAFDLQGFESNLSSALHPP